MKIRQSYITFINKAIPFFKKKICLQVLAEAGGGRGGIAPDPAFLLLLFFFLLGFSFTNTYDSQSSRGKGGLSFIPLYHFHPLTSIQRFICNFPCEMTVTRIFSHNAYVYQTANRWDLPPYWITIWLIDWLIYWLINWLIERLIDWLIN